MKYKIIVPFVAFSVIIFNIIYAGCGSCMGDPAPSKKASKKESIGSVLAMSVPKSGNIDGLVITSCGKCNLGTSDKGCSLSVKIGDKIYPVQGTNIHDHGDAHSSTGFCGAVRVAWAKGKVKKDTFHADSFVLVGESE